MHISWNFASRIHHQVYIYCSIDTQNCTWYYQRVNWLSYYCKWDYFAEESLQCEYNLKNAVGNSVNEVYYMLMGLITLIPSECCRQKVSQSVPRQSVVNV